MAWDGYEDEGFFQHDLSGGPQWSGYEECAVCLKVGTNADPTVEFISGEGTLTREQAHAGCGERLGWRQA